MAKNLFEKPEYEDESHPEPLVTAEDRADPTLAGLTDAQIVTAKTNNLFAEPEYEDEPAAATAPPPEDKSLWETYKSRIQGNKDVAYAAAQGLGGAFNKLAGSVSTVAGALPVVYDSLNSLIGGKTNTDAQDAWFRTFVDPAVKAQSDFELGPDASFKEKATHAASTMLGVISQIVLTGGEAAPEAAATSAPGAVGAAVRGAAEHGAKAMAVPAVSDAVDTGRKVYEATGDANKATAAAQMQYLTSTLGGVVPLSAPGKLATRVVGGAVSGAVTGETSRELMNTVLPEELQQATTKSDVALDALAGGMLGGVMGPRAARPAERPNPLSAIEEASRQAEAQTAAEGGDLLDQALSAAQAHSEATSHHAKAFYEHSNQIERVRMADEARAEALAAEEQAQLEATAQKQAQVEANERSLAGQDDYLTTERPRPADENMSLERPNVAEFRRVEAERAAAKTRDTEAAYRQRAEQEVTSAVRETGEPVTTGEFEPATLGSVMPREVKELGRTSELPKRPVNLFEKPEYEPPATLAERRALPAPKRARFEVDTEGRARAVTEGELSQRAGPPETTIARRAKPVEIPAKPIVEKRTPSYEEISAAAHEAATSPRNRLTEPTEAQREAGNYKKGHVQIQGLDVSIENPKGSVRKYTGGERQMRDHYGYVRGTEGADGDHVDAFVGEHPKSDRVFVVDQLRPDGGFDEHKALIGYRNRLDAVRAYKRNYQSDWKVGPISEMSVDEFKTWLKEGDTTRPLKPNEIAQPSTETEVKNLAQRRGQKLRFREGDVTYKEEGANRKMQLEGAAGMRAGEVSARRRGDVVQVTSAEINESLRGKGHGVRMYDQLAQRAHEEGKPLVSDTVVSPEAARMYKALERRGYDVRKNDVEVTADGYLHSTDTRPVFEVHPKKYRAPAGYKIRRFAEGEYEALDSTGKRIGDFATEGEIPAWVHVDEAHRRKGIASALFEAAKQDYPEMHHGTTQTPLGKLWAEGRQKKLRTREGTGAPPVGRSTDEINRAEVKHGEVVRAIEPLNRAMPEMKAQVLRNHTEASASVRAEIEHLEQQDARGVYDPETDTVYIFSDNHDSPEDALRTAVHEGVAHKGLRHLLTKDFAKTMDDIHTNAKDKAWIKDFMEQHGLKDSNPEDRIVAAEEYAASIAERMSDPSIFRKVVDAVRAALRRIGAVRAWTDADVSALLRKARTALRDRSPHATDRYGHLRFAEKGYEKQAERLPDGHPLNVFLKQGATVEEQANYNPGFVRSRLDAIRDFGENHIEALLGAIPRRNLPDFVAPGKMNSASAYVREAARMDGRRNELLVKADKVANRWVKFIRSNRDDARTLGELMHAATLAGVEPANEYRPKYSSPDTPEQHAIERQRKQQWLALKKFWNALPGEAKALYIDVRDSYAADRDLVMQGLQSRIEATDADGKTKQSLLAELRKKFEAGRVEGPYFPLGRYGKHWAVAKDADGTVVSFTRFEKPSEQRQWLAEMEKAGYKVDGGVQMQDREMARRIDPNFVAKITDLLQQVDPELADEVWQNYLRAMPEMSMRKHFIHRKGRLGFTMDALRNFGYQKFHGAHQIAKLEHMHTLERHLEQMKVEAVGLSRTPEEKWAAAVSKEFDKRHEWMRNPKASGIATALTSLGFTYYLGASPAAALVNLTQNPMVAFPTLAAKFNWTGAGIELTRASMQWAGSRGQLANRLRGDERLAFDEAKRIGLFDKTMAHDLAQIGEEGMDYGSARNKAMNAVSWMFHQMEEGNRQSTFLAAYRLGRRKNLSHEAAIDQAEDIVWDSHFDYSNTNRARYLQSDTAKVLLLFRQYSANMTYRLARDFNNSLRGATPDVRKEARRRFVGILGQTMLFAGASGMPLWWAATGIINTIFGDEDKPYDAEAEMRAWMTEHAGESTASAVLDGPVSAYGGMALNSRVGLNNLWVQEPPTGMEGKELANFYIGQAAGPLGGLVTRAFDAAQPGPDGFGQRGLEKLTPKAFADVLKAIRYARDGVTNVRGDVVKPADQISKYDVFLQGIGFTPYDVALQNEKNRTVSAYSQQIMTRKAFLKSKLYLAAHNDDPQGVKDTMQEILQFNRKNPGVAIKANDLVSSAKAKAKYSAEAVNGLHVEPGLRYLYRKFDSQREAQE